MTTPLKAVAAGGNSAELREWVAGDFLPVANGGTGGTTAAAARSNLGLGAAAVAAILGTVSQSGGVPTGAIIQRGSNANGEFVCFADGTQICTRTLTAASQAVAAGATVSLGAWVYPKAFIDAPKAFHTQSGGYPSRITASAEGIGLPQINAIYIYSSYTDGPRTFAPVVDSFAIGRWF